jgi:hypothetical protein
MKGFKKVNKTKFVSFIKSFNEIQQWNQTIADRIDFKDKDGNLVAYKILIDGAMFIKQ